MRWTTFPCWSFLLRLGSIDQPCNAWALQAISKIKFPQQQRVAPIKAAGTDIGAISAVGDIGALVAGIFDFCHTPSHAEHCFGSQGRPGRP